MLRPSPAPQPRLLVGVADDTLKWTSNPLGVVRWQRSLGAQAVRVWVPWHGEALPVGARVVELMRAEQAAEHTEAVLAVYEHAERFLLRRVDLADCGEQIRADRTC